MTFDEMDPGGGIPLDVVDAVIAADRACVVAAGVRVRRVYEFVRDVRAGAARSGADRAVEVADRSARLELAVMLRTSEYRAGILLVQAEALVLRYPNVLEVLEAGETTEAHADALTQAADLVEPSVRGGLVETALVQARVLAIGPFRRFLRDLVDQVREPTLAERYEEAIARRYVGISVEPDGVMASLTLFMPALEARAAYNRASAIAKAVKKSPGETRTIDQLRVDALADLMIDGDTEALDPSVRGIRAHVTVTVPALSLLGAETGAGAGAGAGAGDSGGGGAGAQVEGVGPIPVERARELCGNASGWMRVLTHPETGVIVSVGRTVYTPPADLARLVRYRAGRCMAPGCGMPASRCEIDHTIAWEHGGQTSADNLAPLCKGHHTIKHHGRWTVTQIPGSGGALEWISPHGRRYEVHPKRKIPTFQIEDDPGSANPAPEHEPAPF